MAVASALLPPLPEAATVVVKILYLDECHRIRVRVDCDRPSFVSFKATVAQSLGLLWRPSGRITYDNNEGNHNTCNWVIIGSDADWSCALLFARGLKICLRLRLNFDSAHNDDLARDDETRKSKCSLISVRAVTIFIVMPVDSAKWNTVLVNAATFCAQTAQKIGDDLGYDVQTLRIVTNPFGDYLDLKSSTSAVAGIKHIEQILQSSAMPKTRIRFAIGEARTEAEIAVVPALIQAASDLANCCVNIPEGDCGLPDPTLTMAAAKCCATLAASTPRGEGNFNFTANFNMPPGCPYFPAAYHSPDIRMAGSSPLSFFGLGLEYPALMAATLAALPPSESTMADKFRALRKAIAPHMDALAALSNSVAASSGVRFAGVDTSAAPSKDTVSLTRVCRLLGLPHFGAAGTLACAQFLTRLFKSFGKTEGGPVDLLGFSGLMLACLEDAGLAAAAMAGHFDITALTAYSAVCGIGLDTVPIPGDTPTDKIAALMRDTGTMAFRLKKPLTVRLFPCQGLRAGDKTQFVSSDLCNCSVFTVP